MKTLKSVLALGVATVLAATCLSGCSGGGKSSGGAKGTVTWSTWGTPDELKIFEQFNKEFMQRHPDIKIKFQPVASYSDYHSKLTTQLSSKTAPDVFYVGDDRITSLVHNQTLAPIDDHLGTGESALSLKDFNHDIYRIAEMDGKTYALPNDVNPDAFWYNKVVLKQAGITEDPAQLAKEGKWTTEKFFEMVDKLKASGKEGAAFWNYWSTTDSIMISQGGKVYDDSGKYVANKDAKSVKALQDWADKFKSGELLVADEMPSGADSDTLFVTDKLGFMVQGRYTLGTIEKASRDSSDFDVVGWPTPEGTIGRNGVASSFLAVNKNAADLDAAFTFFKEFLSKEGQTLRLKDSGNALPSIKGIDEIVTDTGKPANVQSLIEMRDKGFANFPTEAGVPDLSNDISVNIMLPLYKGQKTAQQALDDTAKMVSEKAGK